MIHSFYSIQIYKNQEENVTVKTVLKLYSFVWL